MTLDNVYTQHGRLARVPAFPSLLMSLTFLTGFCPAVFDEILDATEPCAGGEPGLRAEPEPFCTACGANACIFWLYGEEWRHYRPGTDQDGKPDVYDPGHAPVIGWRTAESIVPAPAV